MKRSRICAVGLAAVIASGEAHAQSRDAPLGATSQADVGQQAENSPSDIIVTAQKRSESLSSVPMSITAISGEQLQSRGISTVQDLVRVTPGLSYAEAGNGVPVYSLRGIGFFDTSLGSRPTVSIYVDEAPIPFGIQTTGSGFDLERVEVLKGPQGTLFGQNSTGGAINYIAAKPRDVLGAGATIGFARFATADWQGYVTGPLTSTLSARLAVRTVQGGDWQRSYTRDATLGAQSLYQGRLLLDWKPSARLRVALNLNGFTDHGDTLAGQLIQVVPQVPGKISAIPALLTFPAARANDRSADWDAGTPLRKDNRFYQASLRGDYDLTDRVMLTSLTSYSHMKVAQTVDIDGTALTNALQRVSGRLSSIFTEARLTGDLGPASVIVGANYSHDKTLEDDLFSVPYSTISQQTTPPLDAIAPYGKQTFDTTAVFGNIDYRIGAITLHGGVRYTRADLDYATCTRAGNGGTGQGVAALFSRIRAGAGLPALAPFAPGQCYSLNSDLSVGLRAGTFNQDNISWRAGIDFKPARRVLLYANVSRGYKAGSIPVTATTSNVQAGPVNQENVLAYEIGLKLGLFDGRVDLTGAAFDYEYNDKQLKGRVVTSPNIFGPLESLVNVPKSRIRGAEGQVTIRPIQGLTLSAAGTYLNSKVTDTFLNYTILTSLRDFNGNPFPYTPKWQVNLDAAYKTPISEHLNVMVAADYAYRSSTNAGFGNEALLKIDSYGLLGLRAGIESNTGIWKAEVFGRNITNRYYWTNVAKFFDVARRLPGQPATYGIQLTVKY
ncbi:MAG TPA: TonB-dependent receptor [Sphingobium sp.]|uniref:TonB-dependent receptor n=1 Tax=Sphingobium sp. TaxID=1912891 RepID=UPI002ED225DE